MYPTTRSSVVTLRKFPSVPQTVTAACSGRWQSTCDHPSGFSYTGVTREGNPQQRCPFAESKYGPMTFYSKWQVDGVAQKEGPYFASGLPLPVKAIPFRSGRPYLTGSPRVCNCL
jgi:hypothetical protein